MEGLIHGGAIFQIFTVFEIIDPFCAKKLITTPGYYLLKEIWYDKLTHMEASHATLQSFNPLARLWSLPISNKQ